MTNNNTLICAMARLAEQFGRRFPTRLPGTEARGSGAAGCGAKAIDEALGGFEGGSLYAFASENDYVPNPKILTWAISGTAANCFLLDTPPRFAVNSMLCQLAGLRLQDIGFRRHISDEIWDSVCKAYEILFRSRIAFHRCPVLSPDMLREIIAECGAGDLIYVDRINKMQSDVPDGWERRRDELSQIAFELKNIARECNVPVVFDLDLFCPRRLRREKTPLRLVDFIRNMEDCNCDAVCMVTVDGDERTSELVKNRFGTCVKEIGIKKKQP